MITFTDLTTFPKNMNELRSFVNNQKYALNLSIDELIFSKKNKYTNYNYPSRPPNAFILFRKNFSADPLYSGWQGKDISLRAQEAWKDLPESGIKHFFKIIAESCILMHKSKHPSYDYNYVTRHKKQIKDINSFERNFMQDFSKVIKKINKLEKNNPKS